MFLEERSVTLRRRRFSRFFRAEILIACLVLATAIALAFHEPLTSRRIVIGPGAGPKYAEYAYSDAQTGGRSRTTLDPRRPLNWVCELHRTVDYTYCGFGLVFDGQDAKGLRADGFKKVELNLTYTGPSNSLRVALKNHSAEYLKYGAKDLDKPLQATAPVIQGPQTVGLIVPDFIVAQWWLESARMPPQLEQPDFSNIIAIEVITGPHAQDGTHRIAVNRIILYRTIISDTIWYGTIAAIWLAVIGGLLVRSRLELSRWRRQFASALTRTIDHVPHMVWSSTNDGFTHYNRRWEEFTGIARSKDGDADLLVHEDDRERAVSEWARLIAGREAFEIEYRLRHRSGEYRWVVNKAVPEIDELGQVVGWYGTCTEIHDRVVADRALAETVAKLKWSSENDALTSVANRDVFQTQLERLCAEATSRRQLTLLLIDLDHFKHINDSFGHAAGDELLRVVASRLSSGVRSDDVVARLGGDEFAVLLPHTRSVDEAVSAAAKLCTAIGGPIKLGNRVLSVGLSMGVALYPKQAVSADELYRSADAALYELKRSGRGGVKLFKESMLAHVADAARQLRLARTATRENRLVAFYQPKIDLTSGRIAGLEALLRWYAPGQPLLQSPGSFEEAFKDYELSARIGEAMHRMVAADRRRWRERGLEIGRVSVNAAPAEFLRDDYAERLLDVLAAENVAPSDFEVEITEYALLDQGREYVARALSVLRKAGVTVSLDDFGTGYSSLSHLRDFSVDLVKIDKSFVLQMCKKADIAAIVSSIIALARCLSIDVVAEGVETPQQADLLRSMGCRFVQGHLFGHAMTAEAVGDLPLGQRVAA